MAQFTVVIFTAPPPGQASEAGGPMTRIDGKETVLRAVELFLNREEIKQILVVVDPEDAEDVKKRIGSHFAFAGVKMHTGGPRWLDQVASAGDKLLPETTHVLIHDGARPCVAYSDIDCLLEETAKAKNAVGLTTPVRSTLVEIDEGGDALAYHLPTQYMQLLTPQGFTRKSFEELAKTKTEVHASKIKLIKGSPLNIRCGGPGDEKLVKTMLGMLPKPVKRGDGPFAEAQW